MFCGQFIKFSDFVNKKATRKMVTPDSQVSSETYETYHNKCFADEIDKVAKIIKKNGVCMKVFPKANDVNSVENTIRYNQDGIDLRTYIAIEAMNALLIKTPYLEVPTGSEDEWEIDRQRKAIVESSVRIAALLIKELEKEPDD